MASLSRSSVAATSRTSSTVLAIPVANSDSTAQNASVGNSNFPLAAIVAVAVAGGLVAIFVAYRLYRYFSRRESRSLKGSGWPRFGRGKSDDINDDDEDFIAYKPAFTDSPSAFNPALARIEPPSLMVEKSYANPSLYSVSHNLQYASSYSHYDAASTRSGSLAHLLPASESYQDSMRGRSTLAHTDSFTTHATGSNVSLLDAPTIYPSQRSLPSDRMPSFSSGLTPQRQPSSRSQHTSSSTSLNPSGGMSGLQSSGESSPDLDGKDRGDITITDPQYASGFVTSPVSEPGSLPPGLPFASPPPLMDFSANTPPPPPVHQASTTPQRQSLVIRDAQSLPRLGGTYASTTQQGSQSVDQFGNIVNHPRSSRSVPRYAQTVTGYPARASSYGQASGQRTSQQYRSQWQNHQTAGPLQHQGSRRTSHIAGAPHSRYSRIDLVMPAPLAQRPGSMMMGLPQQTPVLGSSSAAAAKRTSARPFPASRSASSGDDRSSVGGSNWFNGAIHEGGEGDSISDMHRPDSGGSTLSTIIDAHSPSSETQPLSASPIRPPHLRLDSIGPVASRSYIQTPHPRPVRPPPPARQPTQPQSPLDKLKAQLADQAQLEKIIASP
ncbi:hypothetical protein EMMF5_004571 [Cystobasidiomycetes sp. EMM_F5]